MNLTFFITVRERAAQESFDEAHQHGQSTRPVAAPVELCMTLQAQDARSAGTA